MRYYEITITPQATQSPKQLECSLLTGVSGQSTGKKGKPKTYTSLLSDGRTNMNALNIEMDVLIADFDVQSANSFVRVYGISIDEIKQASDLNGAEIEIKAGMAKGLPLAKQNQAGLILAGTVWQAFGNWIGELMTLDLIIQYTTSNIGDFSIDWKAGQSLKTLIDNVLKTNYPDYERKINIKDSLVLSADEVGSYSTINQFARFVKTVSNSIITDPNYKGVDISILNKTFIVNDGTTQTTPKKIDFTDLIGQVTWIDFGVVQFKCPMRADIHYADYVTLPEGQQTQTQRSSIPIKDKLSFQGSFLVTSVRHVGNFRQGDAASWCTIIEAIAMTNTSQ